MRINHRLMQRRSELIALKSKGIPLNLITKELALKYKCTRKMIYDDWEKRNQWLPLVIQLNDPTLKYAVLAGIEQILPQAWHTYHTADNSNAQIGALKLAMDVNLKYLEILKEINSTVSPKNMNEDAENIARLLEQYKPLFESHATTLLKNSANKQVDSAGNKADP